MSDTAAAKAGLHPTVVRFLSEREVAALGSDGNSDTAPSTTEGIDFPIHALTLNAMGVHLLDHLQFEDLAPICERERRWEFLLSAAPLRIEGGTGSPLNPTAIFTSTGLTPAAQRLGEAARHHPVANSIDHLKDGGESRESALVASLDVGPKPPGSGFGS